MSIGRSGTMLKSPPPTLFLVIFALAAVLLSVCIAVTRSSSAFMMLLGMAVLLAGILYSRWVYLLATAIMALNSVGIAVFAHPADERPRVFQAVVAGIAAVYAVSEITHRAFAAKRKAEEALRRSEEYYRFLIENQGEGVAIINLEGRFTFCNPAAGEIFGLQPQGLVGKSLDEFTTCDILETLREKSEHYRGGERDTCTLEIVRPDGERRYLLVTATPWLDQHGDCTGVFAVLRDDTERVEMEDRIRRRERFLSLLNEIATVALEAHDLQTMLDSIAVRLCELSDADGCGIVLWGEKPGSPKMEACYGVLCDSCCPQSSRLIKTLSAELTLCSTDPLVIEDASALFAQEQPASLLSLPLIAGGRKLGVAVVTFATPHTFSADELAWGEQAACQIALAVAKVHMLEEERKRNAELEALREASIKLTSTLELEPVLEAILEGALGLTQAKDAHAFLYDGERLSFGAAMWAPGFAHELYHNPRPDGLTYSVARKGEPIVIPATSDHPLYKEEPWKGAIVGLPLRIGRRVVGVMNLAFAAPRSFDRAELRILELFADQAALAIENARLYRDLRERVAELQRTQQQLVSSARMAAVGQLAAGAAHELNNPLTTIIGYTDLLIAKSKDDADRADLRAIERAAVRARNIVRSLLNFAGHVQTRPNKLDINHIVSGTVLLVSDAAHSAGVVIREHLADNLPPVVADAEQIRHVLFNIMTNAIQAMPDGGKLVVTTEHRKEALNGLDCVAIAIRDTGVGISEENISRIFEPFFTTRDIGEGAGLGLSSALGIVKNHGGEIVVESKPGAGSTFTVLLPVVQDPKLLAANTRSSMSTSPSPFRSANGSEPPKRAPM